MNFMTEMLAPQVEPAPQWLQDKHFMRKHGPMLIMDRGISRPERIAAHRSACAAMRIWRGHEMMQIG